VPDDLYAARGNPFRRHPVEASPSTGIRVASQVMVDKIFAVRRNKCGAPVGALDPAAMLAVTRKLALVTGIADTSIGAEKPDPTTTA